LTLKLTSTGLAVFLSTFCHSVQAVPTVDFETCSVTGGNTIQLQDINITPDNFNTGSVLYSSPPITVNYACNVFSSRVYKPELVFKLDYFRSFSKALDNAGLGMNLTITESGNTPVLFSWDEIKGVSGNELRKPFGTQLPPGTTERTATIKMDILYTKAYSESSAVKNIPAVANVMNIVPISYAVRPNGIGLSSFNIRILRRGLGTVDITPSLVNLGHFYTTWEPSQNKQATFRVTARQVLRPAVGQQFTLPLSVTFGKGALSGDTPQTLNLFNSGESDQPNGLQLSIQDDAGNLITFDKESPLGDITITSPVSGSVSRTYTAIVSPKPGGAVKTGRFSAAIPVTVTYN
ncbi:fimbrial protein, partial [Salmonella enterica subsp. enterica serovar Newport]|nr:fimbrial protein [Salmonella enterica subsp. enterica serovar Newport]EEH3938411.1 fimbrial protein [Salmonella enterica subsp. enterica serovar Newport]